MNLTNKLVITKILSFKISSGEHSHFAGESETHKPLTLTLTELACAVVILLEIYRDEDQWSFLRCQWYKFLSLSYIGLVY